jgi:hypothetical protein
MQVVSTLALLAVSALSASAFAQVGPTYTWEREDAQFGFAVYTSPAPDHGYDAVKVEIVSIESTVVERLTNRVCSTTV